MSLQFGQEFPAGFIAFGIAGPRPRREIELSGQEGQQLRRRDLIWQQRPSWISQESKLSGKTQTVLGSSPRPAGVVVSMDSVRMRKPAFAS